MLGGRIDYNTDTVSKSKKQIKEKKWHLNKPGKYEFPPLFPVESVPFKQPTSVRSASAHGIQGSSAAGPQTGMRKMLKFIKLRLE